MTQSPLAQVYERATEAQANIQRAFSNIDPLIGVNKYMRKRGIPADAITIDCLKTGKRILLIMHDQAPDVVTYQFCLRDQDPFDDFEHIPLAELTTDQLYTWMKNRFSTGN